VSSQKHLPAQWQAWLDAAAAAEELSQLVGDWSVETFGATERFDGHSMQGAAE
jgi:hypothetical protein